VSNLGGYQKITSLAKKVGGPMNLILIVASGGYAIIRGAEVSIKKIVKTVREKNSKNNILSKNEDIIFEVYADGEDGSGLKFYVGDKYKILESDGDAILIEKLGDNDNPYFVSGNFLKTISGYKFM